MESAAQKIEKQHSLTLTGKNNPDNWFMIDGKKTYIPQHKKEKLKFVKNKNKEFSNEIGSQNKNLNDNKLNKKSANDYIENIKLDTTHLSDEIENSKKENNSIISTLEDENKNLGFFSKLLTNTKEINELEINSLKSKNRELNKVYRKKRL
nr:hypothetical protein [Vibrio harveyi]